MNIEGKIRFNTLILYIVVTLAAVGILTYIYRLRTDIEIRKDDIEQQNSTLSLINELIYSVGEVQSASSLYLSTKRWRYVEDFRGGLSKVNSLIDTLSLVQPKETSKLRTISVLLEQQLENLIQLNVQLDQDNPITIIKEQIRIIEELHRTDTFYLAQSRFDTIVKGPPKRNFFQRLGYAFKPKPDSTVLVSKHSLDTIMSDNGRLLPIMGRVDEVTREAGRKYKKNILAIENRVGKLMANDAEFAERIGEVLLRLHKNTLDNSIEAISRSEKKIEKNFTLLTISGAAILFILLLFVLMILFDINKGQRARYELERAHKRTREVLESRHRLLLSVSHDIKSPLGSIMGYLNMPNEVLNNIRPMQNSAAHILALLENLLEFSSLEQGTTKCSITDFELNSLAEEVGEMFMPAAKAKSLILDFESDKVRLSSDRMKIKQILINLVSNSIKYTKEGRVSFSLKCEPATVAAATTAVATDIAETAATAVAAANLATDIADIADITDITETTSAASTTTQIKISVIDTGVGIEEDKLSELYKPFTRIEKNNHLAEGSGLGMFVVKGLVDMLEGDISIFSIPSKGTEIEVLIPALIARDVLLPKTKRIAIFDDDPSIEAMAAGMLRELGHLVVEEDYDTILTDLDMGEISGFDVLESANGLDVVAMSGRNDFSVADAQERGFTTFIAKPFTIEDLRNVFGEGEKLEQGEYEEQEIFAIFKQNNIESLSSLEKALTDKDFNKAQSICHKMLPMYTQFGCPTEELKRMDTSRGKEYDSWREDVSRILKIEY